MRTFIAVLICFCSAFAKAQKSILTGREVVQKSIAYHDPSGNWADFSGEFTLVLDTPDKEERTSVITLDIPNEYFNLSTAQGEKTSFRELSKDVCRFTDDEGLVQTVNVNTTECERTKMYRDYYSYLYGLPMKLNDSGTNIAHTVVRKTFKGKEYLLVQVTYDEGVGSDIWQFYFDPETYAMEIYQFFKGMDETTGEYILLTDTQVVGGIKMPKDRAWYYNKDDGYLGTDKLIK